LFYETSIGYSSSHWLHSEHFLPRWLRICEQSVLLQFGDIVPKAQAGDHCMHWLHHAPHFMGALVGAMTGAFGARVGARVVSTGGLIGLRVTGGRTGTTGGFVGSFGSVGAGVGTPFVCKERRFGRSLPLFAAAPCVDGTTERITKTATKVNLIIMAVVWQSICVVSGGVFCETKCAQASSSFLAGVPSHRSHFAFHFCVCV
jgi:hypothetical protein